MAEHVDDAFSQVNEQIEALKRVKPKNDIAARVRAGELVRAHELLTAAARKITDANAAKRVNSGSNGKASADPFTEETLHALAKGLIDWLGPQLANIDKRLAGLEATQLTDGGVWKPDKNFRPNQLATYRGAIWICLRANTDERPGKSGAWRLMHKTEDGGR